MTARGPLTLIDDLPAAPTPYFIAVEGPTGVGKTALARRLSSFLFAHTFLDPVPANRLLTNLSTTAPSLDAQQRAIRTELVVLALRLPQWREIRDHLGAGRCVLTDWATCKSHAYAASTFDPTDQERLADTIGLWTDDLPKPDLVVHLLASAATLAARVRRRRRPDEAKPRPGDLAALSTALTGVLAAWNTPVLAINATALNLDENTSVQDLADRVKAALDPSGTALTHRTRRGARSKG